jgi:hypothetical protein
MVATATEEAITASLPAGFKNLFYEGSRLRKLMNTQTNNLGGTVEEYGDNVLTEQNVIENMAQRVLTSYLTPERTMELPGLALCLNDGLLSQWAAHYKNDNDTPSGTIKDPARANVDDITFSPINPEVFYQINDDTTLPSNWITTGHTAGDTLEVVGDEGHDATNNTNGNALQLAPDEQVFFTGDFVDLSEGKSIVSKTQLSDVDGEDYGPVDAVLQTRLSGAHILTTQGTYATDSVDIDAKVYEDGDTELVPVGFYLGPGRKNPVLA